MEPTGKGRKGFLIIAEAPGADEDKRGTQLVGKAGQFLRAELKRIGVDLDGDCWKTNAIICRPPNNKKPTPEQIDACRPNILRALEKYDPHSVILLGGSAIRALIGHAWKSDPGGVGVWHRARIPCQKPNVWIFPTFHPSHLIREDTPKVTLKFFRRELKTAFNWAKEKPWDRPPDWRKDIEVIYDPERAARILRKMMAKGGRVAFDYETNMLKPDDEKSNIVCAGVCWEGAKTIAFPFIGEAKTALGELLRGPELEKIAHNNKFEMRWTRAVYGHGVRKMIWCTMQAEHALDVRRGILSLKHLAFREFGMPIYNDHIEGFLMADSKDYGAYTENRIKEIDLKDLMLYCGLDCLLTFKLFKRQFDKLFKRQFER